MTEMGKKRGNIKTNTYYVSVKPPGGVNISYKFGGYLKEGDGMIERGPYITYTKMLAGYITEYTTL